MNATFLLGLTLAVSAPALKDPPQAADLIGLWEHERSVGNGKDQTQKRDAPLRYEFRKDGTYVIYEGDREMVGPRRYTFDPKAEPATLDTSTPRTPTDPAVSLAIYRIEADRLTLCKAPPGRDRPTAFDAPAGSPNYLMTFRRVKVKD
ncbi:MAG TPA: TIGR03067 domain-containing protein [Gemmataceae bacterium]|nr:TIGR03067 domain-containing protein [Gemmataceae bacterium]